MLPFKGIVWVILRTILFVVKILIRGCRPIFERESDMVAIVEAQPASKGGSGGQGMLVRTMIKNILIIHSGSPPGPFSADIKPPLRLGCNRQRQNKRKS